ncbi:MAG: thymidine phosphorylase [Firmicutes bacterium]|nr:thymidine phosphorylase [Bacillota bacterium]
MPVLDLIEKTRDGVPLSREDIDRLVAGIVDNRWPDYQLAAWLMAVVLRGLTDQETFWLTGAMAEMGRPHPALGDVDKHSTGGVGDKTTLVLAPLVAALGLRMAKMSGRGLGHTGGTLDKLESIPGFRVELPIDAIRRQVEQIGVAVVAQSRELAPADRRLYALRDVTGTVNHPALIASSIMSKKLAAGTPNLVLDVKVGNGAFMTELRDANRLARLMVDIGRYYGRRMTVLMTTMQQPLGWAIGNAVEVNEAVGVLRGEGPSDLREEVVRLAAELLHLAKGMPLAEAETEAHQALQSGRAWERFIQWVRWQGGDVAAVEAGLPLGPVTRVWRAETRVTVQSLNTRAIGEVALMLGAGRHRLEDAVNPAVGLHCYLKTGRTYEAGDVLAVVYAMTETAADDAVKKLTAAVTFGEPESVPPLVLGRISTEE